MPRQAREKSQSGYYHILIRGIPGFSVFSDSHDKRKFIKIVAQGINENRFTMHAFCIMNNHVHMLIKEETESVTTIIRRIIVTYVIYFNKKYNKKGSILYDRFKSNVVETEESMRESVRLIHRVPILDELVKMLSQYKWSSHGCYSRGDSKFNNIVSTDIILKLFSDDEQLARKKYKRFISKG